MRATLWVALACVPCVWYLVVTPLLSWRELLGPIRYFKTEQLPVVDLLSSLRAARDWAPRNAYAHLYLGLGLGTRGRNREALDELSRASKLGASELGAFWELVFLPSLQEGGEPKVSREKLSHYALTPPEALRLASVPMFRRELDVAARLIARAAAGETRSFDFQRRAALFQLLRGETRSAAEHLERAWLMRASAAAVPSLGLGFVPYHVQLVEEGARLSAEFSPWLGLVTTSHRELEEASAETLYNLSVLYKREGQFKRSLYMAELLAKEYAADVGRMQLGEALARYLYPRDYAAQVEESAARYGVDPYLVHALIREESHYDASSISGAGALGLMQLMPLTGRWIAGKLKLAPFQDRALMDPARNIEMGCWYLARLTRDLPPDSRQVHWVLAAYNGGPANAGIWLTKWKKAGGAPLESIAFPETRDYVSKVEASYEAYRRTWVIPGPVKIRG